MDYSVSLVAGFVLPVVLIVGAIAFYAGRVGGLGVLRAIRRELHDLEADHCALEARFSKLQKRSAAEKSNEVRDLRTHADRIIASGEARLAGEANGIRMAGDFSR